MENGILENKEFLEDKAKLLGSLLYFTQTFYKLRTGRDFILSEPIGRESHYITVCRELTKVSRLEILNLLINIPPGHGKSELLIHFVAWTLARWPDSQFLYISYSSEIASKHTHTIKTILELPAYQKFFDVKLRSDSTAKDNFRTVQGGSIRAFGSAGSITGQDGGLPNLERFSGAVIMDDMHKPEEVDSDTIRERVKQNYLSTILQRLRGPNVPLIFIGQCLHEDDLAMNLRGGFDGREWKHVVLPCEDSNKNILAPNITPREMVNIAKDKRPYVWAAQFQQNPVPAGGSIFKEDWFYLMDEDPKILATIITADTAETEKDWNDSTVFSFWGLYKINDRNIDSDLYGLHWLDCLEIHVEPAELENEFLDFYARCMRYPVKPKFVAIEKKSTGTTLLSILNKVRGLRTISIERTKASGSKTTRFLSIQEYVAKKQISLHRYAKHTKMCIEHCAKITANNTHARDDIADTLYDAVKLALIDKFLLAHIGEDEANKKEVAQKIMKGFKAHQRARISSYGRK